MQMVKCKPFSCVNSIKWFICCTVV